MKWFLRTFAICFLLFFPLRMRRVGCPECLRIGLIHDLPQALLSRLSHTDTRCIATAVDEYPGFTSPPWQTLDASQHIELIAKLIRYRATPVTAPPTDKQLSAELQEAQAFVQAGGTLKIWRTRLLTFFDGSAQFPVPPGEQTIVLLL